jgi:2-polyprenyl-3-methyl-5-hydroxy-6-metoxy-1,4-benzoquinol methylase
VTAPPCRFCRAPLRQSFVDLGRSPLSNGFLAADQLRLAEPHYPLHAYVCESCLLVQLEEFATAASIFTDYLYFSSFSEIWLRHAEAYAARMMAELGLGAGSLVVEVASNDGYLLQHFKAMGVPVLGVEPAGNVAAAARARGIPTEVEFLGPDTGEQIAKQHGRADLVVANNVFAHVPDIRGFAAGLRALVKDDGMVTLEFPHLARLIERRQYDTIYHEHFSYLSLLTSSRALAAAGLNVIDVAELDTHGGSLRVYARPAESGGEPSERVKEVLAAEEAAGLHTLVGHEGFAGAVLTIKSDLLRFLLAAAADGKSVAGYGAPGKGNTLLNHCGIRSDLMSYTVDRSPVKQGKYLPGTRIPIYPPEHLAETRPDFVLVLPWNLRTEISHQLEYVRSWGAKLVFPIPVLEVV